MAATKSVKKLPPVVENPTIVMPKKLLAKWLKALRSGEYKQGRGGLKTQKGGFCCLGVLEDVADGKVETDASGFPLAVPSREWLERHGVEFYGSSGRSGGNERPVPFLPTLDMTADEANDGSTRFGGRRSPKRFTTIADAIEACAVGV